MRNTTSTVYQCRRALTLTHAGLTGLFLAAGTSVTYRVVRASEFGWPDLATSAGAALLLTGALTTGWMVHARKLRARAEAAEWEAKRLRRDQTLLDGEEDRALWDSVPAASPVEDTCGIGLNVVALNRYRGFPQAG